MLDDKGWPDIEQLSALRFKGNGEPTNLATIAVPLISSEGERLVTTGRT